MIEAGAGSASAPVAAGDVLHLWLRPAEGAAEARVAVAVAGEAETLSARGPTRGFLPCSWTAPAGGEARLAWGADTEVSVAYLFTPDRVEAEGIRPLLVTAENRLDGARHRLHATPPFGWMNDPNGLCEAGGLVHLFYQHNPHRRRWATMHWGHAVSRDGLAWVHQPVAVHPREDLMRANRGGGAYSGSALPLPDGTLRLFHTEREDGRRPASEHQVTALARRGIAGPPAVLLDAHPDLPGYVDDWRDPFVFRAPGGRLGMLLGGADDAGTVVLLYGTDDPEGAGGWRFEGVLHREPGSRVPAECPCLAPLDGEGEGLWLLVFGLIGSRDPATRRRNLSRAYVGRFDGSRFEAASSHEIDFGGDCYATQLWGGPDGLRAIAWAANWTDVFADRDYESAMTFPRRVVWRDGRLDTPLIDAVAGLRGAVLGDLRGAPGGVACPDGLAEIVLRLAPGARFELRLEHPTHRIALGFDGSDLELFHDPPGHRVTPRYRAACAGLASVRVIVDVGLVEVSADDGRLCCTKRIDSDAPVAALRLEPGAEGIVRAEVFALFPPAPAGRG